MTRPSRYLLRIVIFLGLVILLCAFLAKGLIEAFMTSPFLNGVIVGVMLLGAVYVVRQVLLLGPEVRWLERFRRETQDRLYWPDSLSKLPSPRLLTPLSTMLGERRGKLQLSAISMRTLLDGIQNRIDEHHDLSRYIVGLLVFLGLLGTFWGLSQTVSSVGATIAGLQVEGGDPSAIFETLKGNLEQPIAGMGTAFTSSLFGLAGSLIVGFLELQSSQAHSRFMQDLEEWLSGLTRFNTGGGGEGDTTMPAYIQALLEQTADSLDVLQRTVSQNADERGTLARGLNLLNERLGTLGAQGERQQTVLASLAEATQQLRLTLQGNQAGLDEATRHNIRNTALYLERVVQEMETGRAQILQEMRNEIRLLARTIAALAGEQR